MKIKDIDFFLLIGLIFIGFYYFLSHINFFIIHLISFCNLFLYILILTLNNTKLKIKSLSFSYYIFFIIWLSYSLLSFFWAKNCNAVITESLHIINSFTIFFLIVQIINSYDKFRIICYLLLLIYGVYIITGFIEIISWHHLPQSKAFQDNILTFIPFGPFYNQNDFAAALLILTPIIMFFIKLTKKIYYKVLLSLLVLLASILFIVQGARLAILGMLLLWIVYFIFHVKFKNLLFYLFSMLMLLIVLNTIFPYFLQNVCELTEYEYNSTFSELKSYRTTSISIRLNLVKIAVDMAYQSHFLGVGSGNYTENMGQYVIDSNGILPSHNYILEIFATNGLIIFISFMFIMIMTHANLIKLNIKILQMKYIKIGLIYTSFVLYIAFLLPSSMSGYFWPWIIMGLFVSFININKQINYIDEE